MKKTLVILACVAFCSVFAACTTTDTNVATRSGETEVKKPEPTPKIEGDDAVIRAFKEMESYSLNAQKKMDEMAVSEAISQFIAVLAIKNSVSQPTKEILELAKKAETELTKIEAGLLFQAGSEWLDANANQMTASTYTAGKGNGLSPKVMLWYNVSGSRIAVSAAPVMFEFTKGSGLITSLGATNEYGEASVPIARIDNPNKETVIRASIVYTVKGFTYRFNQVSLEFVYVPPSKKATILVLEQGPSYVADDPYIFNSVYNILKKMEFEFIPYNGKLLGKEFMNVFGGDLAAIKKLALEQSVPYLVMVLNDVYSVNKGSDNTYLNANLFFGYAKATVRVVRVADGKILFEVVAYGDKAHDTHGQGNSEDKARRDVIVRITKEMEKELGKHIKEINKALGLE